MTLPAVGDADFPTPLACRDRILEAIRYAYAEQGLTANILPGSDHFIRAEKYAARVSIAIANGELAEADMNPLTESVRRGRRRIASSHVVNVSSMREGTSEPATRSLMAQIVDTARACAKASALTGLSSATS